MSFQEIQEQVRLNIDTLRQQSNPLLARTTPPFIYSSNQRLSLFTNNNNTYNLI
jgi:hypothetical protein